MVRIAGQDLPAKDRVDYALTKIYGIGRNNVGLVLKTANIDPEKRVKDLSDAEVAQIQQTLDKNYVVEGDLRRQVSDNISRLVSINTYRGGRHKRGLPVRGQRTRTNARTKRGKRKTVGALKKEDQSKLGTTETPTEG
jgi:small subunit ribosomal protein S13